MRITFAAALIGVVFAKKHFSIKDKIDRAFDFVNERSEKFDKMISIFEEAIDEIK